MLPQQQHLVLGLIVGRGAVLELVIERPIGDSALSPDVVADMVHPLVKVVHDPLPMQHQLTQTSTVQATDDSSSSCSV